MEESSINNNQKVRECEVRRVMGWLCIEYEN